MAVMLARPAAPMLERICEVPVLPHVVFSVLEPVGGQEPGTTELAQVIAIDPGLTAKTLALANSPQFGIEGGVASITRALEVVGYRSVRTLAMTAGTFEMFAGKNDPNSLRRRRWWRHSVDSAKSCYWLARQRDRVDPDEAYTSGLLHLLGKSLLDRYGDSDYTLVTEREASGEKDYEAENLVYRCNHIELLTELSRQWALPERLIKTFDYRSEPDSGDNDLASKACVAIGTRLATAATRGPELGSGDVADCPDWAIRALGISREQLLVVLEEGLGALQN
jgi:HD-like signal output (HDOD) protein